MTRDRDAYRREARPPPLMARPVLWAAVGFTVGIAWAQAGAPGGWAAAAAGLAAAVAMSRLRGRPWAVPAAVLAAFAFAGLVRFEAQRFGPPGDALSRHAYGREETVYTLTGRVRSASIVLPGTDYASLTVDVESATADGQAVGPGRVYVRWTEPDRNVPVDTRVRLVGWIETALGRVNPGVPGMEDHLRRQGVHSAIRVRGERGVETIAPGRWWHPGHWASRLRMAEATTLAEAVPEPALPFVLAVWLGERGGIAEAQYDRFLASGAAHVLAVSGLHMGIVFASVSFALRLVVHNRRVRTLAVMAAVVAFALTAGARISSLRAALMICVYLSADLVGRERDAPTALGLAALGFLLANPLLIGDTAFQLSFLSVASILLFTAPLERWAYTAWPLTTESSVLARWARGGSTALQTAVAVQVLPLPAAAHAFHLLPFAAPAANLIIIPLLGAVLWLCALTALAGFVSTGAATLFGHALWPLVAAIDAVCGWVAAHPVTYRAITSPSGWAMAFYGVAAIAFLAVLGMEGTKRLRWLAVPAVALVLAVATWRPVPEPMLAFLDVGQGDSIYIRTPEGGTVLVDGGDRNPFIDMGRRVVGPFLRGQGVGRIDCVVATHADRDHIGGLAYVLEHFDVSLFVLGHFPSDSALEAELLSICARRGIPVQRAAADHNLTVPGARISVLHPPETWPESSTSNDRSVVLAFDWEGVSILLPGDVGEAAESRLARGPCRAAVLLAPHHGSRTSSSPGFIDAVAPEAVIISTGSSPNRRIWAPEVIARYVDRGIPIWRTDRHGAIVLRPGSNGPPRLEAERQRRGYVPARPGAYPAASP